MKAFSGLTTSNLDFMKWLIEFAIGVLSNISYKNLVKFKKNTGAIAYRAPCILFTYPKAKPLLLLATC